MNGKMIIPAIIAGVSVTILLTFLMSNIEINEQVERSLDGSLELIGEPYYLGDTIQIVGKINDPNIDFITIEILNSKNNVMEIEKYGVYETNGQFKKNFPIKYDEYDKVDWKVGTYTTKVTGKGVELTKSFEIHSPQT